MSTKRLKWFAPLLVLALVIGACSNEGSNQGEGPGNTTEGTGTPADAGLFPQEIVNQPVHEGTPTRGGTMTFGLESDVLDVSPNGNVIQPADVQMAYAVFDPLLTYGDPDDEEWAGVPVLDNSDHHYNQLADKLVSENDDLQHWTLTLREGITFSNGEPVTAQQIVDHTMWVKESDDCACSTNADNITEVTAVDELTVKYTLEQPVVAFPTQITGSGLGWITESGAREAAADVMNPTIDDLVGAGPFQYQSVSGDTYTLVANENYYGTDPDNDDAELPYLDKLIFQPLNDSVTRLQAVQSDSVQIMQTADTSNLVQAKNASELSVQPSEGSSSTILVLNLTHPPFGVEPNEGEAAADTAIRSLDDANAKKARDAFNLSINRNEINQKYYKGARVPAYGFIPASSPWYSEDGLLPRTDVAKAKELITEVKAAGIDPNIDAMCINTPESTGIFQILKEQAKEVGVEATLNQVEQSVLVNVLLAGGEDPAWDTACFRSPQIADPDGVYGALHSTGQTNLVKYNRPEVDAALDEAREISDPDERKKLYDEIQAQVAEDVVYVPLLFDYYGNVYRNNVSGLSTPSPASLGIIRPGTLYYTE